MMKGNLCQVLLIVSAVAVATVSCVWNGLLIGLNDIPLMQSHLEEFLQKKPNKPHYLLQKPTHHACDGYKGILHIQSGDKAAAAPTVFFQYVISQLIYADLHNLLPWIHLNNVSEHVYDTAMHGGVDSTLRIKSGMEVGWQRLEGGSGYHVYPASPFLKQDKLHTANYTVAGNGVWECYFEPVSDYCKSDKSCRDKPLVTMSYSHIMPGLSNYAPFALRAWPYKFVPSLLKPSANQTLQEWFEPMRIRANEIVHKYFRFQPNILESVEPVMPANNTNACLGLHIRHADKAGFARQQVKLAEFLPYAETFLQHGGDCIYLATDTQNVIIKVRQKWSHIQHYIKTQGDYSVVRSKLQKPVYKMANHDRVNFEVLLEIVALSRCRLLIHGYSAVSESAIYLNLDLHNNSVNLEDPNHMTLTEFGVLVERVLEERKMKLVPRNSQDETKL